MEVDLMCGWVHRQSPIKSATNIHIADQQLRYDDYADNPNEQNLLSDTELEFRSWHYYLSSSAGN
jgi:hypothetical protein